MTDHFVTVTELADEIRVPPSTLRNWRRIDPPRGPRSIKFGRRTVYKRSDVDAWLEAQEQSTARGGVA